MINIKTIRFISEEVDMKKLIPVLMAVLLLSTLFLSACDGDETTTATTKTTTTTSATTKTTTTSEPTQTTTTSATEATWNLKLAHSFPPQSMLGQALTLMAEEIGEETGGRVAITVYGGGSLLNPDEFYDGVARGIADIGYGHPTDDYARYGFLTAFSLPGLHWPTWPSLEVKNRVAWELRDKYASIMEEKAPQCVDILDMWMSPYVINSTGPELRVPADMDGIRITASGFYVTIADYLGATPVDVPAPDRYMAMERGLVDCSWDVYGGIWAMKLFEVGGVFHDDIDFGAASALILMNRATLESMPEDIQAVFYAQKDKAERLAKIAYEEEMLWLLEAAEDDPNQKFVVHTAEELAEWDEAFMPLRDMWVEELIERGWPAQEFLDDMLSLKAQYEAES